MEELIVQVIGCIAEVLADYPEILGYRWVRWAFAFMLVVLIGCVIYFSVR